MAMLGRDVYERAYAAAQVGDVDAARTLAEDAAQHGSVEALRLLGLLHGDTPEARQYLQAAAAQDDPYAHALLAQHLLGSGDPIAALQQLRAIAPANLDAFSTHLLARASWLTGDHDTYLALIDEFDVETALQRPLWPSWLYHRGTEIAWANYHLLCLRSKWQQWFAAKVYEVPLPFNLQLVVDHNHPHTLVIGDEIYTSQSHQDLLARIDPYGRELLLQQLTNDLALAKTGGCIAATEWCERAIDLLSWDRELDTGALIRDIINLQILGGDITLHRVLPNRLSITADLANQRGDHFTHEVSLGPESPPPNLHHHEWLSAYLTVPSSPLPKLLAPLSVTLQVVAQWDAPSVPLAIWALLQADRDALTDAGEDLICRWIQYERQGPLANLLGTRVVDVSSSYLSGKDPRLFADPEHNDERILRVWETVVAADARFAHNVLAPILALHRVSGDLPKVRQAILELGDPALTHLLESTPAHGGASSEASSEDSTGDLSALPPRTRNLIDTSVEFLGVAPSSYSPFSDWPTLRDLDLEGASALPVTAHHDIVVAALAREGLLRLDTQEVAGLVERIREITATNEGGDQARLVRSSWHEAIPAEGVPFRATPTATPTAVSPAFLRSSEVSLDALEEVISGPLAHECAEADHDPEFCLRRIAAGNSRIPSEWLSEWARAGDSCLKLGVAANSAATTEELLTLTGDWNLAVRNAVLGRPQLPIGALVTGLAQSYSDENYDGHELVPGYYDWQRMSDDFNRGAADPRVEAIIGLSAEPRLLQDAWLAALTWNHFGDVDHEDDGYVAHFQSTLVRSIVRGASFSPDASWLFDSLIEDLYGQRRIRHSAIEMSHIDGENTTTVVVSTPLNFQASIVASLCQLPYDAQQVFAQTGSWDLRLVLAGKPEITTETLITLYETEIVADAASNYNDHEINAYLAAGLDWEEVWPTDLGLEYDDFANTLHDIADELETAARARAAMHPNFPPALLVEAALSKHGAIRAAAARSPHAMDAMLEKLAVDPDIHVRRGVASNPAASDEIRALAALQE